MLMQAPFPPSINETKMETKPCEHLELAGEEISFPLTSHWLFGHNSIEAGWQWREFKLLPQLTEHTGVTRSILQVH